MTSPSNPSRWQRYGKAFMATAGATLTVAYGAINSDQIIDSVEGVQIAIAATAAVGVYLIPLAPQYRWAKTALATVMAALQVLVTVILGGLDGAEWIAMVIAAVTVLSVGGAPAVSGHVASRSAVKEAVRRY